VVVLGLALEPEPVLALVPELELVPELHSQQ